MSDPHVEKPVGCRCKKCGYLGPKLLSQITPNTQCPSCSERGFSEEVGVIEQYRRQLTSLLSQLAASQEREVITKRVKHCQDCGGDFYDGGLNSPECPYCQITTLRGRIDRLEGVMRNMLESARPNPKEHPAMFAAWQEGEEALSPPSDGGMGVTDTQRLDYVLQALNHTTSEQFKHQVWKEFRRGSRDIDRDAIDFAMSTHQPSPASEDRKEGE